MNYIITKPYVFIVLEHHTKDQDSIIHGIYCNRSEAEGKVFKLHKQGRGKGYIAILKKSIQGKPCQKYCF